MSRDLLFEIGCEELPAPFVAAGLVALTELTARKLNDLRLTHGALRVYGTPRRLAVVVADVSERQPDLSEVVTGPPVKAAFRDGAPTKAAEAFAQKLGCATSDLRRVQTPKGEYVVGTRSESGRPAVALLGEALRSVGLSIPFRKSMRWGSGDITFGRPIRWLVALFGTEVVDLEIAGVRAGNASRGHRFLSPGELRIASADAYLATLREAHVLADPAERRARLIERLHAAAAEAGGKLIEDEFLYGENLSLVEEPHVVAGSFERQYLELPDSVILEVARGHQRYFGLRDAEGALLPRYLAVVNTALAPDVIRLGNDRVMRARLADAQFFFREDSKIPLQDRREKLEGIVFQQRLGTVLAKARRIERLARELGLLLQLPEATLMAAASGAHLCKCDLITLMVGEFPELQGEMGRAYALAQGADAAVADVIREHYLPRSATDALPPSDAAALVAMADRLDTLVGCFAVGLTPTGTADPYGLRRACIAVLRTLLYRGYDLRLTDVFRAAYDGFEGVRLDKGTDDTAARLEEFFGDRLRGLLADALPSDVVEACLAATSHRPLEVRERARALSQLDAETRARAGEVFKRATNIAREAPPGPPRHPREVLETSHETEAAVHDGLLSLRRQLAEATAKADYKSAFAAVADFAPLLARYFVDVYVMSEEAAVRDNRLRLMREISETCSRLAHFQLLGGASRPAAPQSSA